MCRAAVSQDHSLLHVRLEFRFISSVVFQLLGMIDKGLRPEFPPDIDDRLKALIKDCWEGEPGSRPLFPEVRGMYRGGWLTFHIPTMLSL